jgi:Uri superfamily endonuclease
LRFIFCSFIAFKVFEIANVTNEMIEELLYNANETDFFKKSQSKTQPQDNTEDKLIINKFGICINKSQHQTSINEIINANKTDFDFLANEEGLTRYKNDKQNKEILNYVFKYFGLNLDMGRETDKHIFISLTEDTYHYRIQKTRLQDATSYANELDDKHFWINHKTPLKVGINDYKTHNLLPKILLYNPFEYIDYNKDEAYKNFENKKPNSKFASSELLRYYILNFCKNNDNTKNTNLLTHLNSINSSIKSQFIKVDDYIFDDTTQRPRILQLQYNYNASINTTKNKIVKSEFYNCECGATIDNTPYKIKRHNETKQHIDFITPNPIVLIPDEIVCECGGKYKNSNQHLKQHIETKQHIDFLTPKPIVLIPDEIVCECGGKYKNSNQHLKQHNKGKKHIDFTKKQPK